MGLAPFHFFFLKPFIFWQFASLTPIPLTVALHLHFL